MTSIRFLALALLLGLVLTACGPSLSGNGGAPESVIPTAQPAQASGAAPAQDLARADDQGAVTLVVTPLNLGNPGATLDFDVAMNTHSVDLGMDLTTLATLTTDTGRAVQAIRWDAPQGGHHVEGKLSFPASVDGASLLQGAAKLTLTLRNVDTPERAFVWEIPKQ